MKSLLRVLIGICAMACMAVVPCLADSVQGTIGQVFQIDGTLTETGNACGQAACQEVIQFTSDLHIFNLGAPAPLNYMETVGNSSSIAAGALGSSATVGSFYVLSPTTTYTFGWLPIFVGGQEIDVFFTAYTAAGGSALTLNFGGAQGYSCLTDACAKDFILPQYQPATAPIYDATGTIFSPVTLQASVKPLPEADASALLVVTLAGVVGFMMLEKRRKSSKA